MATARAAVTATRAGLGAGNAAASTARITIGQRVLERVEHVLILLDQQAAEVRLSGAENEDSNHLKVLDQVRQPYLAALAVLLSDQLIERFNMAEATAARLPRALTELALARMEQPSSQLPLLHSEQQMIAEWAGWIRRRLDSVEAQSASIASDRASGTSVQPDRERRFSKDSNLVSPSIGAVGEWMRAVDGYQYLSDQGNLIPSAYGSLNNVVARCHKMRASAYAEDETDLRARLNAHRADADVQKFYQGLPVIAAGSRMLVGFGIALAAAAASAGVGSLATGAIGTTETLGGTLLAAGGTAALEAITFTAVTQGLQQTIPGQVTPSTGLADLAWNFGLFLPLRLLSVGLAGGARSMARSGIPIPVARGVAGLGQAVVSFPLLHGYELLPLSPVHRALADRRRDAHHDRREPVDVRRADPGHERLLTMAAPAVFARAAVPRAVRMAIRETSTPGARRC